MTGVDVGVIIAVLTLAGGIWWRIYTMIQTERTERTAQVGLATAAANLARGELAEHKLHVAETYVTKTGMSEQTAQILKSIENIAHRIDSMHERLDSWSRPPARRS